MKDQPVGEEQEIAGPTYQVANDPELLPPLDLMRTEGIDVLEEWFRWGEEWSMLLRIYGCITRDSRVLEVGCGLGRIAFPLRYVVSPKGSYEGFDISREKIEFLQTFQTRYPNFSFSFADIHNTYYNPTGTIRTADYRFPYPDASFDIVFAASVFTHMLPEGVAAYLVQASRMLAPGGRCVASFFLLDNYLQGRPRPLGFARPQFDFDHPHGGFGDEFAIAEPDNPEQMTAYRLELVERLAAGAGLVLERPPLPGLWSGASATWAGAQDVVVLTANS